MQLVHKKVVAITALCTLVLTLAVFTGAFEDKLRPINLAPSQLYKGERYLVTAQAIELQDTLSAMVSAQENTRVASRILAQIKSVEVRAGQVVKQGQVIATLADEQLQATVKQIRAQSDANEVQLAQAQKQLSRVSALLDRGLVARDQVDNWQSGVDELSARRTALAEQLKGAKVALGYTQIVAPISGVVVERLAEPGDMVTPGTPVVDLFNPASLQISASVGASLVGKLQIGAELAVRVGATAHTLKGKISEIVPVADNLARQFLIKLDVVTPTGIKPGMYAEVYLPAQTVKRVLIPRKLVKRAGQLNMVDVIETGVKSRRLIRLGPNYGENVVVISGLNEGEILAI
ncbi:efflux RND transporter periplasmic adaptor subunit [Pseudoalteromonas sp. SMS1]|uniref:efflux RND transporter periplasmic adaptor subunit n=1 Tax=Pseudoalteromonas sp. SMS1 TaxID=2908894 RepID=UPI001F3BE5C9|nr:efflux RND transporter periplasmic adaptor subunit [Pseudoalteromonas sp. SMS1]MCF2859923.1 efflux RND transporter periplasmic adaptor subunit [Pseudoalteromonas sp. SMS1]